MKSPSSHENAASEGPKVDLSGSTPEQQQQAADMLCQEADAFASHDEDIGCIEQLQTNIKLTDNESVQKTTCPFRDHCTFPPSSSIVCARKMVGCAYA